MQGSGFPVRRAKLARLVSEEDRAAFDRNGFVVRRGFPPEDAFARLSRPTTGRSAKRPRVAPSCAT